MSNPNPSPETRFRPGGPGGPGRRPSRPLTDRLRERLEDPAELDAVVDAWLLAAKTGDTAALRMLLERTEGKLATPVESGKAESAPTVADAMRVVEQIERDLAARPPTEIEATHGEPGNPL